MKRTMLLAAIVPLQVAGLAAADQISITVENTSPDGGFFLTPFWVAAHNGGFDSYDGGTLASNWPGLTEIAETGDTGPISAAFAASAAGQAGGLDATIAAISGDGDAPVFSPGESATFQMDIGDPMVNRYFSYASMVIPSNDLFVANGNPFSHMLFDAGGNFTGPITIEIYGSEVNDNGSEVNDAFGGAAFSANGGVSVDEKVVIRNFFTDGADTAYLNSFLGTQTANGATITSAFGADDLIARITIVPAPGALALMAVPMALSRRRRRD